jgi:hypothetical protein
MPYPVALVALLLSAGAVPAEPAADAVTIYRCTNAAGHLTLRDTPCASNEKQQTLNMLRPKDAPATPRSVPVRVRPVYAPEPSEHTVYHAAPKPMFECATGDGTTYTSDTGDGNPRWVPLWTLGYPLAFPVTGARPQPLDRTGGMAITNGSVQIDAQRTILRPPGYGPGSYAAAPVWVHDDCHELPPDEVCARLVDRRDAIRTRFFNAMPSERDQLRIEERGINARLGNDCGGG